MTLAFDRRPAATAALALLLGLGPSTGVMAQESAREAAPAEQPAPTEGTLDTIPVRDDEPQRLTRAASLPYTYGAARLRHSEYDGSGVDGVGVEGSYLLLPNIFAIAAFLVGESDGSSGTESSQLEIGAGYRTELSAAADLNATLRLVKLDLRSEADTRDELGYQFDLGVRGMLLDRLEGSAGVSYVELYYQDGDAFLTGTALYEVMPQVNVGVESILGADSASYGLLGRWVF